MKILKESVRDVSNDFNELEELLSDVDYVVSIYSKLFYYTSDSEHFTIENLKNIFDDFESKIAGSLKTIEWKEAYETVFKYLSYATHLHGVTKDLASGFKIASENARQHRMSIFENIIKKYIVIPPEKVIEHIPSHLSYFSDFCVWGLCFIYLNEGVGIVIYFETSD